MMKSRVFSAATLMVLSVSALADQMAPDEQGAPTEKAGQPETDKASPPARTRQFARPPQKDAKEAPDPKDPDNKLQKVTVTNNRMTDMDQRRLSTASKLIYGREELDRNGDSTLGEIMKRLPGVTVGGKPGRGGDIRMRGMGSGYTQILLNGERPPGGFSLDAISPDQIERIEIYRAPVAEFSTRAIAGTINIVLREDYQQKFTSVRISDGIEGGRHAPNVSVSHPGTYGALTYLLSGTYNESQQRSEVSRHETGVDPQGNTILDQMLLDDSQRHGRSVQLTPRFNYKFESGDTLMLQPFLMTSEGTSMGNSLQTQVIGPPRPYTTANWHNESDSTSTRLMSNWQHRFDNGSRLTVRLGGGAGRSNNDNLRYQYDAKGVQTSVLTDSSDINDTNKNFSGKYTFTLGGGHSLATGWDSEWGSRTQTRVSLENGLPQFIESGETLSAHTRRLAAYAQDEWDISPEWATSLGLRWEGITTSSSRPGDTLTNRTSVYSPVAHLVYRIPGSKKDQIRAAVTHSYRPPGLADLIALPVLSPDNSPTRPDRIGNRELKPELSTGVDLAFEHYLTQSGLMSINIFNREIRNLMRRQIGLTDTPTGPRWVSQPKNIGKANTRGVELEAKFQLQEFLPSGPNVDVRSNYSHFWSDVDGIPGPNNRLDAQPNMVANLGLDYRFTGIPLTIGGNLNWTPAYVIQTSTSQLVSTGVKKQLDLSSVYRFNADYALRLSVNNLTKRQYLTGNQVILGGMNQNVVVDSMTYTTWTLRLEMKL